MDSQDQFTVGQEVRFQDCFDHELCSKFPRIGADAGEEAYPLVQDRHPLTVRLRLMIFVLISVSPVLAFILVSGALYRARARAEAEAAARLASNRFAGVYAHFFEETRALLSATALLPIVRDRDLAECYEF